MARNYPSPLENCLQLKTKLLMLILTIYLSGLAGIFNYLTIWIGGNIAVHMRKVDNPECKVISLIVDADTERCGCIACLDMCVEITHFSRRCGSVRKLQFWLVNCAHVITKVHIVNTE